MTSEEISNVRREIQANVESLNKLLDDWDGISPEVSVSHGHIVLSLSYVLEHLVVAHGIVSLTILHESNMKAFRKQFIDLN